jgi:hypothetical protein
MASGINLERVLHITRQLGLGRSWSAGVKQATASGINLRRWESGGDVDFLRGRRPTGGGAQTRWWRSKSTLELSQLPIRSAETAWISIDKVSKFFLVLGCVSWRDDATLDDGASSARPT